MGDFCSDDLGNFNENFGRVIEVIEEVIDQVSEMPNVSEIMSLFDVQEEPTCDHNCYPIGKCMGTTIKAYCFVDGQEGECCVNGDIALEELLQ